MKELITGATALNFIEASTGYRLTYKTGSGGWYEITSPCPLCGKNNLYVHDANGVFKCHTPGCKLGKATNSVGFVMDVTGLSFKEASAALISASGCHPTSYKAAIKRGEAFTYDKPELLSNEEKDKSYRAIMNYMTLLNHDKADLLRRGLSEKEIATLDYKSYRLKDIASVMSSVKSKGCKTEGLAGAFKGNDGNTLFVSSDKPSYLIWAKDLYGNICGAQINTKPRKTDEPSPTPVKEGKKKKKYIWLSSASFEGGWAQKSIPHFAVNRSYDWRSGECTPLLGEKVYLIEGLLKGDICHIKTGKNFICLAGVMQYDALKKALATLKQEGVKEVIICWDMDYKTNQGVGESLKKAAMIIKESGFSVKQLEWDERFKGLDDYIVANGSNNLFNKEKEVVCE